MWKIPFFSLYYDEREEQAVQDVIRSRWLTQGDKTSEFEKNFSKFLTNSENKQPVYCVAVSNCTAALHIALLCADVGPGDEVIVPALTFVADANMVHMCGAKAVFADSDSLTDWNISVKTVEKCVTKKTKAIIAVHYAGCPCEMDELIEFCMHNKIVLIEDSAHAIGATYKDRHCGTLAPMSCFSFFSNKNLSVGEGGMFVTSDPRFFEKAKLMRSHGMTSLTIDRWKSLSSGYNVLAQGHNYRIDEIRSALGLVQLSKLDEMNALRRSVVAHYNIRFLEINEVKPYWVHNHSKHNPCHHIYPILIDQLWNREAFLAHMKENKIQVSKHYDIIPHFTAYANLVNATPVAEQLAKSIVTLPLYPSMTKNEVDFVVNSIKEFSICHE